MKHFYLIVFSFLSLTGYTQINIEHQRTCGTMIAHQENLENSDYKAIFETATKIVNDKILYNRLDNKQVNEDIITIPIVFHVIHNGEPLGEGTNLSKELIEAQIDQLNLDFRALNSDINSIPTEFAGLVSDLKIEFCLAAQDPNGIPTRGINRYNYGQGSYDRSFFDNIIKPETIWDRDYYLNIWTGRLNTYLGYAQLPIGGNANMDGVVVRDTSVGSVEFPHPTGQSFNKGRTATHEIGHWLFLYHIWGNDSGDCSGTDLVDDTPNQGGSSNGSPIHPQVSCDSNDMFMNYMDYVVDAAMHMFSKGQKERTDATLTTMRYSLLNSNGCISLDDFLITANNHEEEICIGQEAQFDINLDFVAFFEGDINFTVLNEEETADFEFSNTQFNMPGSTTLNITNTQDLSPGLYEFTINATDGLLNKTLSLSLNVVDIISETPLLLSPNNNSNPMELITNLEWQDVMYATSYQIEVSTDGDFNNLILSTTSTTNILQIQNLAFNTQYFWRVKAINVCSGSFFSLPNSFNTVSKPVCSEYITDGGFEESASPNIHWKESSYRGLSLITNTNSNNGSFSAALGRSSREVSIIYQTITIPEDAVLIKLSYDYAIESLENSCGDDYGGVAIRSENESSFSNGIDDYYLCVSTSTNSIYSTSCIDLSQYVGQTIDIGFYAVNDWFTDSTLYVDNIKLTVCDDAAIEIPFNTNTYIADYEVDTLDEWTHYIDDNNTPCNLYDDLRLLSVKKNEQNIGKVGDDGFQVSLNSNPTASSISTIYNNEADDYFAMNRYWEFKTNEQPSQKLKVKHYYTKEDFLSLNTISTDSIESQESLIAYKIHDATNNWNLNPEQGHSNIYRAETYKSNGWWYYTNGEPSTTQYKYSIFPNLLTGRYQSVEYEVGSLGSGGLAIKNSFAIHGNVFYDNDGLSNSIVDGFNMTPLPQLFAVLLNQENIIVDYVLIGQRRTSEEGKFTFYNIKRGNSYRIYLSSIEPIIGDTSTSANLPLYYEFTGESIGFDIDANIDGNSSEFILDDDLYNVNFGIFYFQIKTVS